MISQCEFTAHILKYIYHFKLSNYESKANKETSVKRLTSFSESLNDTFKNRQVFVSGNTCTKKVHSK